MTGQRSGGFTSKTRSIALALGGAIAAAGNVESGAETSPLLVAWRDRGWLPAALLWACILAARVMARETGEHLAD